MIISIASDHAGFDLKTHLISELKISGISIIDSGCYDTFSCDYPDYAKKTCKDVIDKKASFGVLICGTGIGMSICANKFSGIRAALCTNELMAEKARQHNDANILVLGARITKKNEAVNILIKFLESIFEGGRHQMRLNKFA
ncbi:MAG: ribose 5-phosphate isomerase B [Rickettsiaceae bacterium]|nr:ribose 5-phosphate isomerase B [Rickettsiaceae bacterium]